MSRKSHEVQHAVVELTCRCVITAPGVDPVQYAAGIFARQGCPAMSGRLIEGNDTEESTGRDPDAPCADFIAGEPATAADADCETDGHYRCLECTRISLRALRRRRDECEECGRKLASDESCPECDRPASADFDLLRLLTP